MATAELVCSGIKDATVQVRRVPGTALANDATAEVTYTPPEGEDQIRSLLANWERVLHGEDGAGDIDPLVRISLRIGSSPPWRPCTENSPAPGPFSTVRASQ